MKSTLYSVFYNRLEAYDRNQDFNKRDSVEPAYAMHMPEAALYKDVNSDTPVSRFSCTHPQVQVLKFVWTQKLYYV